jgi:hypothetical protein
MVVRGAMSLSLFSAPLTGGEPRKLSAFLTKQAPSLNSERDIDGEVNCQIDTISTEIYKASLCVCFARISRVGVSGSENARSLKAGRGEHRSNSLVFFRVQLIFT